MTEYDRGTYIEYITGLDDEELLIEEEDCILNMSGEQDDAVRSLLCKSERKKRGLL